MDKLKPCPFCGCAAHFIYYDRMAVVYCVLCGAEIRMPFWCAGGDEQAEVIRRWNSRTTPQRKKRGSNGND